eukprot:502064_1
MTSFISRYCRRSLLLTHSIFAKPSYRSVYKFSAVTNNLRLGDISPNFRAETTHGPIDFHHFIGNKWCILFSHPADYTPVCTTELGMVEKLQDEFAKRNTKCIGLSCDDVNDHNIWIKDIVETQNCGNSTKGLSYPMIADKERNIATLYGMLDDSNIANDGLPLTVRSVFIIGPDKQIKLMLTYPASTGRNFDEILRVIDSLQLTAYHKVATPVNWKDGDECVIVPSISNADAKNMFPKGFKEVKPYLRITPQPNK